jgi:hypothetical protein
LDYYEVFLQPSALTPFAADVWNELDEISKKKFIESVQEVDIALSELKKKINIKD